MHWFFFKNIATGQFTFDSEESKHIIRVLRLKNGDLIHLTDGAGKLFIGKIVDDNPKKCSVIISDHVIETPRHSCNLHIAVAPTKNLSRLEWFVEKATEIGISEITPMTSDHSERENFKIERLERIAISAIKQSKQVWLPAIKGITSFGDVLKSIPPGEGFIAYVDEGNNLGLLQDVYISGKNVTILIGPEGDFSKSEINAAMQAGVVPISLGKNRLRTETAALVACFTINLINQQSH